MAITNFKWDNNQGFDLHVLRNNHASLPLDEIAIVLDEPSPGTIRFASVKSIESGSSPKPSDYDKVQFIPRFISTHNAAGNHEGNGIEVDIRTGEIKADSHAAPKIHNFVIDAKLSKTGGQPDLIISIRVHVHDDISGAWLTPATLTIRPDATRGISELVVKYVGANPIVQIKIHFDPNFSLPRKTISAPAGSPFPSGHSFTIKAVELFPLLFFPDGVFLIPLFLEIPGAANPQTSIPTRFGHLLTIGQKFNDFEIVSFVEKGQFKFSVYAEFDDGVVGDVTQQHGVTWGSNAAAASDGVTVGSDGAMLASASAVGKSPTIEGTLPARLSKTGVTSATGKVNVKPSWVGTTSIAELLPGSPGANQAGDIPNVLFLSDGFTDKKKFDTFVRKVHKELRNSGKTSPWDHLFSNSMNAWSAFIDSREEAATILYESAFLPIPAKPNDAAAPIDAIVAAAHELTLSAGELSLQQLIEIVGLPVAADSGKNLASKLTEWKTLFDSGLTGSTGTGSKKVNNQVFTLWERLGERRLINERDTALGIAIGEKPRYHTETFSNNITYNSLARLDRKHLNQFLNTLTNSSGTAIGHHWGQDALDNRGKDYSRVVTLSAGTRLVGTRTTRRTGSGASFGIGIMTGLVDNRLLVAGIAATGSGITSAIPFAFVRSDAVSGRALRIDPFPIPAVVPAETRAVVAHELCHDFRLQDEYARPGPQNLNVPAAVLSATPPAYNIQAESTLLTGGQIDAVKIQWRWPRIRKAGVLLKAPSPAGASTGPFTIELLKGHGSSFNVGDEVYLRLRDLLATPSPPLSHKLKITSKTTDVLQAEPVPSATIDLSSSFDKGSVLLQPVPAPSNSTNNPTGDTVARLLSPLMQHQINSNHKPQTASPCVADTRVTQVPVNLPSGLIRPRRSNLPRIVGLFAGGLEFSCGVYHPSGECIMRSQVKLVGGRRVVTTFCPVCRYALVDQIDPSQHEKIDKDYDRDYPRKV